MEKPRKPGLKQFDDDFENGCNTGERMMHDAMSTWIEGEVKELIEELERVDHHTVAEEIWRIQSLLRKLTGK